MPNHTPVTPHLQKSIADALESIDLRRSCLEDLRQVFRAILQAESSESSRNDAVRSLANVGQYLCEEWQLIANNAIDELNVIKGFLR